MTAPSTTIPSEAFDDDLLAQVLALPSVTDTPWHRDGLRCVRTRIVSIAKDVASCATSEGETLLLPVSEFPPQLSWQPGREQIALRFEAHGRPWLSCNRPELVALLAEGLVPELRRGDIRIMGLARSPGVRTKMAVAPTGYNPDGSLPDPVASIVGKGANRVRRLSQLLGGERLDVVAWHDEVTAYVRNAFAPASVEHVELLTQGEVQVSVPRHQMAAAVGDKGLNASLAGQLAGVTVTVIPS